MKYSSFVEAADGTQIWYGATWDVEHEVLPEGEVPLVLCDGFACDGFIWPYLIDHFYDHYYIVRWHYRGHGESENPVDPKAVTIDDVGEDLTRVLDILDLKKVHLLGHSMGVQVILSFAHMYPERVSTLIPICGTYKRPLETLKDNDTANKLFPYLDKIVTAAPKQMQFILSTVAPSKLAQLISRTEINAKLARQSDFFPYLLHISEMDIVVYFAMLKELAEHDAEPLLSEIKMPTLIITGENDTFTPTYRSIEMHEMIPDSELLIVPNATHIAPLELPDLVNARIEKFLRKY